MDQLFLVVASGEQLKQVLFALAVGSSQVEVDRARHLERLVLAPERQERLVFALAIEVDPERPVEQSVLALAVEVYPEDTWEDVCLRLRLVHHRASVLGNRRWVRISRSKTPLN